MNKELKCPTCGNCESENVIRGFSGMSVIISMFLLMFSVMYSPKYKDLFVAVFLSLAIFSALLYKLVCSTHDK